MVHVLATRDIADEAERRNEEGGRMYKPILVMTRDIADEAERRNSETVLFIYHSITLSIISSCLGMKSQYRSITLRVLRLSIPPT